MPLRLVLIDKNLLKALPYSFQYIFFELDKEESLGRKSAALLDKYKESDNFQVFIGEM